MSFPLPCAALLLATLGASPALAAPARQDDLEARLKVLEAAVAELRSELAAARAAEAAAGAVGAPAPQGGATAAAAANPAPSPAQSAAAPASAPAAEGFRVGATTVRLNGFFKANALVSRYSNGDPSGNAFLRDFYLPQQIPIGGVREGNDFDSHAKQTRIWMTTATPIGSHTLRGHLEFDFQTAPGLQGTERTTNGYNPALRRAFINLDDRWLFGQEWSVFQNPAALPETTDFIGPTEGTVFVRQPQIRFTHKLSPQVTLAVSAENPETATLTSAPTAILTENDDDRVPDLLARLSFTPRLGEITIAAVARQLSVDNGSLGDKAFGYGLSLAGRVPFGPNNRHDIRFMLNHGDGIGRYIGLNFAPDALFIANRLQTVSVLAGFAAVRVGFTDQLRSTLMGSFQDVGYPSRLAPPTANESAWSVAGNLFYSPVKNLDLGIEYRHGVRRLLNGEEGELDRIEAAARYSF